MRPSALKSAQRHCSRTLPCSSAAPTLIPKCTKFLALARRSCTTSMFPCSKDFSLPAFHQRRCALCESLEIENVLATKHLRKKTERTITQKCRSYSLGESMAHVHLYCYRNLTQLQRPCMAHHRRKSKETVRQVWPMLGSSKIYSTFPFPISF